MSTMISLGDYEICVIDDQVGVARPPAEIYPSVPDAAWDPYRSFALTQQGFFQAQWRGHVVRRSDGRGPIVVVDTGMGPGPYEHTGRGGELLQNLTRLGITPEQVTVVVTTHTHGDHVGWNLLWDGVEPRPVFPNAAYYVARADWEHYSRPENTNAAFDKQVKPLDKIAELVLVEGELELADGIKTLPTNGHTPGHQCVLVDSSGKQAVLTGDLFHSVAQVSEQNWCPVYDWDTEASTKSRRWLLGTAQEQGWIVCSGHLPTGSSMGKVVDRDGVPAWEPV